MYSVKVRFPTGSCPVVVWVQSTHAETSVPVTCVTHDCCLYVNVSKSSDTGLCIFIIDIRCCLAPLLASLSVKRKIKLTKNSAYMSRRHYVNFLVFMKTSRNTSRYVTSLIKSTGRTDRHTKQYAALLISPSVTNQSRIQVPCSLPTSATNFVTSPYLN
jgi:hypothetical protein